MRTAAILASALWLWAGGAVAADLSPARWPEAERARLERLEQVPFPIAVRAIQGRELVSATLSPIAAHVGLEALRQGGTAADAAVATALTQVATDLGAVVSYAGVGEMVYFEARTGRTYVMDANWAGYAAEREPQSIPAPDLAAILGGRAAAASGVEGRKTLVPGFMAGMQAANRRFGRLRFAELLAPSIWYAEQGVPMTPLLTAYLNQARPALSRTPEGRAFLARSCPRFAQPELAAMLRRVAASGAREMYAGAWARAYVETIRREGGAATLDDLRRYRVRWEAPSSVRHGDAVVLGPGAGSAPAGLVLDALGRLGGVRPDYWRNTDAFASYARALRPAPPPGHHSAAVVAIDRWGNVAALVHSINSNVFGDTGIVVQGVPVGGSAGLYRERLAAAARIPGDMAPVIAFRIGRPVAAAASVGSSLAPETVRIIAGLLGGLDPAALSAAPPLLVNVQPEPRWVEAVPAGAYPAPFRAALEAQGVATREEPAARVAALRGTTAFAVLSDGLWRSAEVPGVITFGMGR